jgi:Na+/pantothenate symporter
MGLTTSIALVALLAVLMLSYGIFAWADHVLTEYLGGDIVTHAVAVVVFAACVCRFRD